MLNGSVENERQKAMERLAGHSFTTEKGSVYTYDESGRTSRFKIKTGEHLEPQDITVFSDLNDEENRIILDAIFGENPEAKKKVYVVETAGEANAKIIRNISDVTDPRNLFLVTYDKNGKILMAKKATLKPTLGYTVFDTKHFQKDGEGKTERHLGHKVIKID